MHICYLFLELREIENAFWVTFFTPYMTSMLLYLVPTLLSFSKLKTSCNSVMLNTEGGPYFYLPFFFFSCKFLLKETGKRFSNFFFHFYVSGSAFRSLMTLTACKLRMPSISIRSQECINYSMDVNTEMIFFWVLCLSEYEYCTM